jgi:transcription elongation factor GreA
MADEVIKLTKRGYEEKKEELYHRENELANEISDQLKYAKSLGDFSENAELDAAREAAEKNNSRIAELHRILDGNIQIIKATIYKVLDLSDNEEYTYELVGETESSILENRISMDSPFGKAVAGHKVGDTCKVELSTTDFYKVKILEITKE